MESNDREVAARRMFRKLKGIIYGEPWECLTATQERIVLEAMENECRARTFSNERDIPEGTHGWIHMRFSGTKRVRYFVTEQRE